MHRNSTTPNQPSTMQKETCRGYFAMFIFLSGIRRSSVVVATAAKMLPPNPQPKLPNRQCYHHQYSYALQCCHWRLARCITTQSMPPLLWFFLDNNIDAAQPNVAVDKETMLPIPTQSSQFTCTTTTFNNGESRTSQVLLGISTPQFYISSSPSQKPLLKSASTAAVDDVLPTMANYISMQTMSPLDMM